MASHHHRQAYNPWTEYSRVKRTWTSTMRVVLNTTVVNSSGVITPPRSKNSCILETLNPEGVRHAVLFYRHEDAMYVFNANDGPSIIQDGFEHWTIINGIHRPLVHRTRSFDQTTYDVKEGACMGIACKILRFIEDQSKREVSFEDILQKLQRISSEDFLDINL